MLIKVNRQRLFLGKQTAALFRLIPDVLCQLIVLREGRAQIDMRQCVCCGACIRECPMEAIAIAETDDTEDNE